jgi:hypothetical protein
MAEALQKFESRDPDFRKEGVDETGDEQADAHVAPLLNDFPLCEHCEQEDRGVFAG